MMERGRKDVRLCVRCVCVGEVCVCVCVCWVVSARREVNKRKIPSGHNSQPFSYYMAGRRLGPYIYIT
jgi:hypothetical protein